MKDKPIYRVVNSDPKANRPFNWGERYYYANPQKEGNQFAWLKDNINVLKGKVQLSDITPAWTFNGKWDPEATTGPRETQITIDNYKILISFDEPVTVIGTPEVKTHSGRKLVYVSGAGSNTIEFRASKQVTKHELKELTICNEGKLLGTKASVAERNAAIKLP